MAWNDTKSTGNSLTAAEWNAHVTDQESRLANVVEDTTPQLGGNLDLNSNNITGTGNINVTGTLDTTGNITTSAGNIAVTSGNITTSSGNIIASSGKIQASNSATNEYAFEVITTGNVTATVNAISRFDCRGASSTKNVLQIDNDGQGACIKADSNNATPGPSFYANGGSYVATAQSATGDGTTTIDWDGGNYFNFQFGAFNETFTFTAPSAPGTFILKLVQDSVGSRTVTWPGTVKWPGGTAPTLTTTATTGTDIITFYYDGTNYYGVETLDFS